MLPTAEVRWFYPGAAPLEIVTWFGQGERPPETQPPRTDYYLRLGDTDSLGIKLREGKLEIKQRQQSSATVRFGGQVAGRVALWRKWSFPLAASGGDPAALLAQSGSWLAVHKARRVRQYELTPSREVRPVPATLFPAQGCGLELTAIRVEGGRWWSLAFEAFGDEGHLRQNLLLVGKHVLARPLALALEAQHSFSYPRWLRLIGP